MRKLITGVDAAGRSCIVDETELTPEPAGGHGVSVARVFATTESPPPPRPAGLAERVDVALAPGLVRWMVVDHGPHDSQDGPVTSTTMHHSDAIDLVFVQDGSADLVLQDGAHEVTVGDLIVMPGVDHAWKAGPEGCRLVVVKVGTPPPGDL